MKILFRNLLRNKGYSLINIAGLAIGMACCIFVMLYVQDEFKYDRYPIDADRSSRVVTELAAAELGSRSSARSAPSWGPVLASEFPEIESYMRLKSPLVSWMVSYMPNDKRFHEPGFYFADETVFDFFSLHLVDGDPASALTEPSTVVLSESISRTYFGS